MLPEKTQKRNIGPGPDGRSFLFGAQTPDAPACSAGTRHQSVSLKIASALLVYAESANLGQVLQAPYDVVLSRNFIVQPDILFVETRRTGLIGERALRGAPDVAIEILSWETREKDMKKKRNIYSTHAVKEYWTVDPESGLVEVLRWSELGYATQGIFGRSDHLSSPAFPRLRLPLRKVFGM